MPDNMDRDIERKFAELENRIRQLEQDAVSVPVRFAIGGTGEGLDLEIVYKDTWGQVLNVTPAKERALGFGMNDKHFGVWIKDEWILISDYFFG